MTNSSVIVRSAKALGAVALFAIGTDRLKTPAADDPMPVSSIKLPPLPANTDVKTLYPFKETSLSQSELFWGKSGMGAYPDATFYKKNSERLDAHIEWILKPRTEAFPLKEPTKNFQANYFFQGKQHTLDDYLKRQNALGFLVLHEDQIIYERYFNGSNSSSLFRSNSIAKSFLSTLIGVAIDEKKIKSVNDPVVMYLPYLSSGGFRDATIKDLLQMSSGVEFGEDYLDPKSDFRRFFNDLSCEGKTLKSILSSIQTKVKPGTKHEYQSINSFVLGVLLEEATGKRLNEYFQEKIWSKLGVESDAFYCRGKKQLCISAAGSLSTTLRDYGRFGLMVMNGGELGNDRIVSKSWLLESISADKDFLKPKRLTKEDKFADNLGYGYQWWLPSNKEKVFMAMGIYGQAIYVDPTSKVVIVQASAWSEPDPDKCWDEMIKVMDTIAKKVHP